MYVKSHEQQVTLKPNSYLRTNRLMRKMTSNKISFLNTPPLFNYSIFYIWQDRFKMFIQSINHELWETINDMFIPTYQVNGKVVDKLDSLWTKEEKRKFDIDFKTKSFIKMSLDDSKFFYVHQWKTANKI